MMPSSSSSSSPSSYIGNLDVNTPSPSASTSNASTQRVAHRQTHAAAAAASATTAAVSRQSAQAGSIDVSAAAATSHSLPSSASTTADPADGGNATSNNAAILNVAGQVTAGATKIVGWTFDNMNILDTSTSKSGLRPMHVRVSVRVHHVAFLHPGLDNGGRTKMNGGRFGKWKLTSKKNKVAPPGLLRFGSKKGDWTNPKHYPHIPSFVSSSHGIDDSGGISGRHLAAMKLWKDDDIDDVTKDTTKIAEIISAEAFRLSRDGIIQHHFALHHALSQPSLPNSTRMGAHSNHHIQTNNTQDQARYYKELSERSKGYRRLVMSSSWNGCDLVAPNNPNFASHSALSAGSSSSRTLLRTTSSNLEERASSDSLGAKKDEKDPSKEEKKKDETLFDNVEYQYVGPPKSGPEFFQLLRHHGAATFGRHLPELSCMVPNNAIVFELRQSKSKKKCTATQPFVVEAPHVIWGDARDKLLSRIAKEGCPMIDSRKFEYVSNDRIHDAEFTESLMVTGSTLWVKNARIDKGDTTSVSSNSSWSSTNSKRILKARYYGGKMVDGLKEGVVMGAKGTAKTHNETWKVAEKGTMNLANRTKEVVDGAKQLGKGVVAKLPSIPDNRELTTPLTSHFRSEDQQAKESKINALKIKIRRRKKRNDYESLGDESTSTNNSAANLETDAHLIQKDSPKNSPDGLCIRPVHYELLTDDIIEVRIVSFPNKDDVIASFPISVASVMTQRSVGDRVNDPLKPSELTLTLVQEPSAPLMRWGVELKVTIRAVEVKPRHSRMITRPMPVIADKIPCVKDGHVLHRMAPEEIVKDLQTTEDQLFNKKLPVMEEQIIEDDLQAVEEQRIKEENELNDAIVTYGYKQGDNEDELAPKEIRLRQMFYCEREHGAIARKMERKSVLGDDEREMINDARADPSIMKKDNSDKGHLKLLEQLCKKMPGIEDVDTIDEQASLDTAACREATDSGAILSSLEKVSWTMAKSLNSCFGELMENSARCALQSRLLQNLTAKCHPRVTRSEARAWCSQVASKLSACVSIDNNINEGALNSSIAMIQSIIFDSAHESRIGLKESVVEEMKLDEDEIAMSETIRAGNLSLELDSTELVEWVAAVSSLLLECAEELDDDQSVPTLSEQEEKEIATPTDSVKQINDASTSPSFTAPTEQKRVISPDSVSSYEGSAVRSFYNERNLRKTTMCTLQSALPRSDKRRRSRTGPSSEIFNKYHSQQANMQPSSLVFTLAYLTCLLLVFLCALGTVVLVLKFPHLTIMY